jgi:para-nitrobenzyl esterase
MAHVDRREFLGWTALAAAGVLSEVIGVPAWAQDVRGLPLTPVVPMSAGRLRGVERCGVNQFWGVPYAAPSGGANRFMPPAKVAPWSGVRDCFQVGNRSPQGPGGPISEIFALNRQEPMGEDCLNLNLFTPGLGSGNRAVMVWLHGGGFFGGSGNWLLYDGTNLARQEEVVMVSVTHRLNLFGFLHLADLGGEKWANSSNMGMQDIVAALTWIQENIAAFGGNPGNVTVFGHSGGGSKATTLMAMPSAKGLIHRAIAMSGALVRGAARENATRATEQFLGKLGLKANELDRLQQFSWKQLQDVYFSEPRIQGLAGGPVVDGRTLPRDPWYRDAPAVSAEVPLMAGSSETEGASMDPPPPLQMSEDEMLTKVRAIVGKDDAKARQVVALYRMTHAGISNTDVWLTMSADNAYRANAQLLNELKTVQGKAPSYLYYFAWRSPVHKGQMKAFHGLDIPFALYNVDEAASMTGAMQERYALAHRMSAAFASFARTGNPNHADLPNWPAFNARTYPTIVFANECKVLNDPNREERLALKAIRELGNTTATMVQ